MLFLMLCGLGTIGGAFLWAEYQVQRYLREEQRGNFQVFGTTGILREGKTTVLPLLVNSQESTLLHHRELHELSPHIVQAVLAIEDRRFFEHHGIDLRAIARAAVTNLVAGGVVQGASTLTQQLAKNLFLSPARTFTRKIQELFIALVLELHLTKDELLTLYLNTVYLGQEGRAPLLGFAAASESFFRKDAAKLSIAEAALLAGIIKAPSSFNPRRHPKRAQERREQVLLAMQEIGYLSEESRKKHGDKTVQVQPPLFRKRYAPFFEVALRQNLSQGVYLDVLQGLPSRVITGLSQELQQCGEEALVSQLRHLEKNSPALRKQKKALEAGLVALDPTTGSVRAWVGGRDYSKNQFDHVLQAKRPIGSTVKPFIYLTALDPALNSYRAATLRSILPDEPISVKLPNGDRWSPSNADRKFRGNVTLRYALERSLNLPPIHVTRRVGVDAVRKTLQSFRIHQNPPRVLALALGAVETDLLSLTAAYGALANEGRYIAPKLFEKVVHEDGELLYQPRSLDHEVADPGATFLVTDALKGVVARGTGRRARPKRHAEMVAGKTGTSQDGRDAWFIGYVPRLVTGVWVGFDDNAPLHLSGGSAAAPIWKKFMECADPYLAFPAPIAPRNVVRVVLDGESGERYTERCPEANRISELFLRGSEPIRRCSLHGVTHRERQDERDGGEGSPPSKGSPKGGSNEERRDFHEKKKERGFFERIFGL
ncbi:PBP1A family penicillin-binding protein [bacterium]|nr:PBP1A family penicillin-binding protein [bacterium]